MELTEFKTIWQDHDKKLSESLRLNRKIVDMLQSQQVKTHLEIVRRYRVTELIFHGLAVVLLLLFIAYNIQELPYVASGVILILFYGIVFTNCINQILIIRRMDYSNDIITLQSSLVMLQTHIIHFGRLAILCLPAFLAFPLVVSKAIENLGLTGFDFMDIRKGYAGNWWTLQWITSLVMLPFCIWLYRRITYRNVEIKWVKDLIQGLSGVRIRKAMEFLNEMDRLKRDAK